MLSKEDEYMKHKFAFPPDSHLNLKFICIQRQIKINSSKLLQINNTNPNSTYVQEHCNLHV